QGHNATYKDEWRIIQEKTNNGAIAYDTGGRPSNLTTQEPNVGPAKPKVASGE
ncbi:MAG: hypothetical protein HOK82_00045, partial [Rhodospirillaceae bacterium]|nr:hypothetical protein [Rhodospirillaceae bacterium]